MKYFRLEQDFDKTGVVVQIQEARNFGPFGDDSFNRHAPGPLAIDLSFVPVLHPDARLTPVLASFIGVDYLLASSELIKVFKKFRLPSYQTWELEILDIGRQQSISDYCLFRIDYPSEIVSYKESEFYSCLLTQFWEPEEKNYINITSSEEFLRVNEALKTGGKKLALAKAVLDFRKVSYDLIRLPSTSAGYSGYYVSQDLKTELQARFEGLSYKEANELNKNVRAIYS